MMRTLLVVLLLHAVLMISSCISTTPRLDQETSNNQELLPPPGTEINGANYNKYMHLFPPEFLIFFKEDIKDMMSPIHINVVETKSIGIPHTYLEISKTNEGKYDLNAEGHITPSFDSNGIPFPNLHPGDKDFVTKLMWNYAFRYSYDDMHESGFLGTFQKRKGMDVKRVSFGVFGTYYKHRLVVGPKPDKESHNGLYSATLYCGHAPESLKGLKFLVHRHLDITKQDTMYLYLPRMKRVLRGETGQRSTPIVGSILAPDDFFGFDGQISNFIYTLLGDKKILAIGNSEFASEINVNKTPQEVPFPSRNYEIKDVYIIQITPKDPKYPQKRKIVYMDKDSLQIYYSIVWDRADNLWKVSLLPSRVFNLPDGEKFQNSDGNVTVDIQFGIVSSAVQNASINIDPLDEDLFMPKRLLEECP